MDKTNIERALYSHLQKNLSSILERLNENTKENKITFVILKRKYAEKVPLFKIFNQQISTTIYSHQYVLHFHQ